MLDRRTTLAALAALLGVASFGAPPAQAAAGLAATDLETLTRFAGLLIPATDTPGAVEAGVPAVLAALVAGWAAPASRRSIEQGLAGIRAALQPLKASAWPAALHAYDAARLAAGDGDYRRVKDLVIIAYYMSEAGATQELRYELAPGVWIADLPLAGDRRAWAT